MHGLPQTRLRRVPRAFLAWLACSATGIACAGANYEGTAYAVDGGKLLYHELHASSAGGDTSSDTVTYLCPDGKAFARKELEDGASASAPDFEMTDGRSGYVEGARAQGGDHRVYVRANKGAEERSAELKSSADLVIDAGFDAFVRGHWNDLVGGKTTTIAFLVPSRLETLSFDVEHIGRQSIDGQPTEHFRLELAKWYGGLLPHIDVFYDAASKRLRRYVGVSNVRDADNKNVAVRIEFPPSARAGALASVDPSAPLDGRCAL